MKIVKFVPAFSRLSQTFIYNLACGLQERLPEFRVLTIERENVDTRPFDAVDVPEEVTAEPQPDAKGLGQRLLGNIPLVGKLVGALIGPDEDELRTLRFIEYLEREQPDLVHAHFGPAAYDISAACEATDTPLMLSLRGYDASRLVQERKWVRIYREMLPKLAAIVMVTGEMRQRIEPLAGDTRMLTIHAGKNADEYTFEAHTGPVRRFLSIGRLAEKKGHLDSIRAIERARDMGADVGLRIIGEGDRREALEAYIDAHELWNCVELAGRLPHEAVKEALSESDAFIIACRTAESGDKEGVPNVIKEAQLAGLPVISTRHAGVPDAVPEQNQRWLAAEGDWEHLAELIDELSRADEDTLREMTEAGREHIETHFSLVGEVDRYAALYEDIIERT